MRKSLEQERQALRVRATAVNLEIARLREVENVVNEPVVPELKAARGIGSTTQLLQGRSASRFEFC
jgi:hypothetical protein